jgi:hypothetical protein
MSRVLVEVRSVLPRAEVVMKSRGIFGPPPRSGPGWAALGAYFAGKVWHRVCHFSLDANFSAPNICAGRQLQARWKIHRTRCPVVERRK